jgi:hypothetical protein
MSLHVRGRYQRSMQLTRNLCCAVQPWWDEIKKQWPKTVLQILLPLLVMWVCWLTGAGPFNKDLFPPSANTTLPESVPSVTHEAVFTEL